MKAFIALAVALTTLTNVLATQICYPTGRCLETFVDPTNGVEIGFALPLPGDTTHANELIGQIDAPIGAKWVGIALGGAHNYDPLIVAWTYPWGTIRHSVRQNNNYGSPTVYSGPIVTTIETSFTATRWQWTFRCQNCLSWSNVGPGGAAGSITTSGYTVFGFASNSVLPGSPSVASSSLTEHDYYRMWGHNMVAAQTSSYSAYLLP